MSRFYGKPICQRIACSVVNAPHRHPILRWRKIRRRQLIISKDINLYARTRFINLYLPNRKKNTRNDRNTLEAYKHLPYVQIILETSLKSRTALQDDISNWSRCCLFWHNSHNNFNTGLTTSVQPVQSSTERAMIENTFGYLKQWKFSAYPFLLSTSARDHQGISHEYRRCKSFIYAKRIFLKEEDCQKQWWIKLKPHNPCHITPSILPPFPSCTEM